MWRGGPLVAAFAGIACESVESGAGPPDAPVIVGEAVVGAELRAAPAGSDPAATWQWQRCGPDGLDCEDIDGETDQAYVVQGDDILGTVRVRTTSAARPEEAEVSAPSPVRFEDGTVCNASGEAWAPPAVLEHVIVILMENRDAHEVAGNGQAPYFNSLRDQCGSSTAFLDNTFEGDLPSLPHYLVLTAGSNCEVGIGWDGEGCITGNVSPYEQRTGLRSIFEQVGWWRAYQEDMPSSCDWGNPARGTRYWAKHNPPPYFERLDEVCDANDIGIRRIDCSGAPGGGCSQPANAFVDDLANDALPRYAFVTPDIVNCMHDGNVAQGDNWLATYLPLIFASSAYQRGGTAVYVVWDEEGGSFGAGPMPNLFVSPFVRPHVSSRVMNLAAVLRATEDQLGIGEHLGCAGGTPPGGVGWCAEGSTTDLRAEFGF